MKAEIAAESAFDPNAVSAAGAQGLGQHMPGTWSDAIKALNLPSSASPFDPRYAIPATAWYLGILRAAWKAPRPEDDRRRLVQASYNAGLGNILKAQKLAGGANDYASIVAHLPAVTGAANASETTDYVARISHYFTLMAAQT